MSILVDLPESYRGYTELLKFEDLNFAWRKDYLIDSEGSAHRERAEGRATDKSKNEWMSPEIRRGST